MSRLIPSTPLCKMKPSPPNSLFSCVLIHQELSWETKCNWDSIIFELDCNTKTSTNLSIYHLQISFMIPGTPSRAEVPAPAKGHINPEFLVKRLTAIYEINHLQQTHSDCQSCWVAVRLWEPKAFPSSSLKKKAQHFPSFSISHLPPISQIFPRKHQLTVKNKRQSYC